MLSSFGLLFPICVKQHATNDREIFFVAYYVVTNPGPAGNLEKMTLRQRATTYRASFFTETHYRQSSEGLPSGLSPSYHPAAPAISQILFQADLGSTSDRWSSAPDR